MVSARRTWKGTRRDVHQKQLDAHTCTLASTTLARLTDLGGLGQHVLDLLVVFFKAFLGLVELPLLVLREFALLLFDLIQLFLPSVNLRLLFRFGLLDIFFHVLQLVVFAGDNLLQLLLLHYIFLFGSLFAQFLDSCAFGLCSWAEDKSVCCKFINAIGTSSITNTNFITSSVDFVLL